MSELTEKLNVSESREAQEYFPARLTVEVQETFETIKKTDFKDISQLQLRSILKRAVSINMLLAVAVGGREIMFVEKLQEVLDDPEKIKILLASSLILTLGTLVKISLAKDARKLNTRQKLGMQETVGEERKKDAQHMKALSKLPIGIREILTTMEVMKRKVKRMLGAETEDLQEELESIYADAVGEAAVFDPNIGTVETTASPAK